MSIWLSSLRQAISKALKEIMVNSPLAKADQPHTVSLWRRIGGFFN